MVVLFALFAASCGSGGSGAIDQPSGTDGPFTSVQSTPSTSASSGSVSGTGSGPTDRVSPWPTDPASGDGVASWTIEVLASTAHDPSSYLQGLELADDVLYESAGLYGESSIRIVDPSSGDVLTEVELEEQLFGEGLTVVGDELLQITWREGRALRWDRTSLEPLGEWSYEGEGWGICLADQHLVMSDGTDQITWRNPDDFSVIKTVAVTVDGESISAINELECIDGLVMANIYTTTDLIVIDPESGQTLAVVDASELLDRVAGRIGTDSGNVLNGIADLGDGTLLLGGKRWPEMFTVRLIAS